MIWLSSGIMFESESGMYDGLIFWTSNPRGVLEGLRYLGWPAPDAAMDRRAVIKFAALLASALVVLFVVVSL